MGYIVQSAFLLGVSYLFYLITIRRASNIEFKRWYLLLSFIISLGYPLAQISIPTDSLFVRASQQMIHTDDFNIDPASHIVPGSEQQVITQKQLPGLLFLSLFTAYSLVSLIFIIRFFKNLIYLYFMGRNPGTTLGGMKIVPLKGVKSPFSFFNLLFVDKDAFSKYGISKSILWHEQAHSRQLHSIDIILLELSICFLWFNPFVWLYKKEMNLNHEYLADKAVLLREKDRTRYARQIIETTTNAPTSLLGSNFSYLKTKNRIQNDQ